MTDVSHETLPPSACNRGGKVLHPERDGRLRKGTRARETILRAALAFIAAGNFRPSVVEIARRAGVSPRLVHHHFASQVDLFCRIAQEHTEAVLAVALGGPTAPDTDTARDLAWAIMVGTRRPRS
jgi:AcrR family transcriptional regulator